MQPLIDKYAINPDKNTVFLNIIKMFDGKPNYQLWAVKVVFSKVIAPPTLNAIKEWMDVNPELIKKLSKNGNLVCYTSKDDFTLLHNEMETLSNIKFVKGMIANFNTDQRKLILKESNADVVNGINAFSNAQFVRWFNILKQFNMMSANTKKNVIHRISAERNADRIYQLLNMALDEKYKWNHDDLLAFVAHTTPDCEVVFDDGNNIVLLRVPSYESAKKLCYGDTSWCICNSDSTFRSYTSGKGRTQYFYFDFSKRKDDELSHVGFTVDKSIGITNAHSKSDQCMISGLSYQGKRTYINDVLTANGIKMCNFMKLKGKLPFEWDKDSLRDFIKANNKQLSLALDKDKIVVISVNAPSFIKNVIGSSSLIDLSAMDFNGIKTYLAFNTGVSPDDDESFIMANYKKDKYGTMSLVNCRNIYGTKIDADAFTKFGILQSDFLGKEKVDPAILLHKYIDEENVSEAVALLKNNKDIDVNYVFNGNSPIFSAIENYMVPVIKEIMNSTKFEFSAEAEYGESLLMFLILAFYLNSSYTPSSNEKEIRDIITTVIESDKTDINYTDLNNDTAVSLAATDSNMLWLLEKLISNPAVDINIANELGYDTLDSAIVSHNQKAVDMIIKLRKDAVLDERKYKLAKANGISLSKAKKGEEVVDVFAKIFAS